MPQRDPETARPLQSRLAKVWSWAQNTKVWLWVQSLLKARRFRITRLIGLIVSIAAGIVTVIKGGPELWEYVHRLTKPNIELAFYDEDADGHKHILHENKISVDIQPKNMSSSVIHVPIRLALKNVDAEDLNNVRVKIWYDPSVRIHSEALQKILGGSAIYEQDIGHIDRQDEYVFLPKTDELSLKVFTAPEEIVTLSKDQVPMCMVILVIVPETENPQAPLAIHRNIPIEVSVLDNRAPLTKPTSLNINLDLKFLWPPEGLGPLIVRGLSDKDRKLVHDIREAIKSVSPVWTAPYDPSRNIAYYKLHTQFNNSDLQLFTVNNDLRYIEVSTQGDGKLDYQLFISPEPGQSNKQIWGKSLPIIDWRKSAVPTKGNSPIGVIGSIRQQ